MADIQDAAPQACAAMAALMQSMAGYLGAGMAQEDVTATGSTP
ncbi:MAG TPA: hypothetical protein VI542_20680 [Candidatus Tectomicrobia bacterium]